MAKVIDANIIMVCLLSATQVLCGNVSFEDCGGIYDLEEVMIDGCNKTSICVLPLKRIINVSAVMTASSQTSKSLVHEAFLILNNIQTPLTVSPDACVASPCPINSQAQAKYAARFTMPTSVPLHTRGHLGWRIRNESNHLIMCFRVTIETTNYFMEPATFIRKLLKDSKSERRTH